MGKDQKKFQKKKAQKAAKRKAKKTERKKHIVVRGVGAPLAMRGAFQSPLYQCWEPQELFHRNLGIGSIVVTRKTEHHKILIAVFLVDVFCLGVKDAFVKLLSEHEYQLYLRQLRTHEKLQSVSPACARKLVEDAEAYARDLGFEPHKDYHTAKKIFGDLDPAECSRTFEFGRNGTPLYIAGPHDSQTFQKRVIEVLTEKLGPEGLDFVLPVGVPPAELFE